MKYNLFVVLLIFLLFLQTTVLLPVAIAQSGQWLWGRGNTGGGIDAYAVATDSSGNVYGAGFGGSSSFGAITVPYSGSSEQAIWVKYSPTGTALWADGTQNGNAYLSNITTDANGDLIVFGVFDSHTLTIGDTILTNPYASWENYSYFIAKYNPTGTLLWVISDGDSISAFPGISLSAGLTTDHEGNIYIASSFHAASMSSGSYTLTNTDASGQTNDIFVAKYNSSGGLVWATSAGGISDDDAYSITIGAAGNVYISGCFYSPSITVGSSVIANPWAVPIAYIAEFSSSGLPLWAQAAGGSKEAYGIGLISDASGNVYMTGGFRDSSISFGSTTITRTYPAAVPNFALFLVQYSPSNVVTWSKTIGSPTNDLYGFSIALAPCGEVWVSGNYSEDATIDGQTLSLVAGTDPIFIAGYDLTGNVLGYSGLGSGGDDQNAIACDPNGNVFVCADYENGAHESDSIFYIGPDTLPHLSGGEYFYIGKYSNIANNMDSIFEHMDTTFCMSNSIILSAPVGFSSYSWYNGSTSPTLTITSPGAYWVNFLGTCNSALIVDTFNVSVDNHCLIYLPNAFTPNNDGKNDIFRVLGNLQDVQSFSFNIYNRWGQRVFHTEDVYAGWNGNFNGIAADIGTYFYMLNYSIFGQSHILKGDVELLR